MPTHLQRLAAIAVKADLEVVGVFRLKLDHLKSVLHPPEI